MESVHEPAVDETLYRAKLDSGLEILVLPKPGFQQKYAVFGVGYGSVDNTFVLPGTAQATQVPDGIAHFLEHKLFDKKEGNVFEHFARLGASANAYTSYAATAYLFSTTDGFLEALRLLLEFVTRPYFSERSVRKEQGIIEQEIRMYEDDPDRCVGLNLLQALYRVHPIRIDIGGTVESIRRINPDLLHLCHRAFYRPDNMVLAVAGALRPETVVEIAEEVLGGHADPEATKVERTYPDEPAEISRSWVSQELVVSKPRYCLGFKETEGPETGTQLLKRYLVTNLVLQALLGKSSGCFQKLYEAGLIDDGFGGRYLGERSFGHTIIGGETPDPQELNRQLSRCLQEAREQGIDPLHFDRIKRRELGRIIQSFDSPDAIANGMVIHRLKDTSIMDSIPVLRDVSLEDLNRRLREHLNPERSAVSVILPRGSSSLPR